MKMGLLLKGLIVIYGTGTLMFGFPVMITILALHTGIIPLLFRYCKSVQRRLVFTNFVQWPINTNFENPQVSGINGGRNLSIEYVSKVDTCPVKIGLWHILPQNVYESKAAELRNSDEVDVHKIMDEEIANSGYPIVLYCHGNANSRVGDHRLKLYKVLTELNYHVVTFDYRGYGDSTNLLPTEDGVIEDSVIVYEWLMNMIEKNCKLKAAVPPVFVWGHSLGTAISSNFICNLNSLSKQILDREKPLPMPKCLILESPFNNLQDEVTEHFLCKLVSWLPYFEFSFVEPFLKAKEYSFKTDEHLAKNKKLPVLILHAKDDWIVPYRLGRRLFDTVIASRTAEDAPVILHSYDESLRLGHKRIYDARDLPTVINNFVSAHVN